MAQELRIFGYLDNPFCFLDALEIASEKAKFYEQYKEAKEELLKLKTAKQNVASFFREEEPAQQER